MDLQGAGSHYLAVEKYLRRFCGMAKNGIL